MTARNVLLFSDLDGSADDWWILATVALTGAVAGFLCIALVEFFHPLPKPPAAAT